jgi:polyhydroxyalkanoate synthesis regulator phasin
MGKYNTTVKTKTNVATTHEGGQGYKYDSVNELISLLATGVNNTYYETMGDREDRLSKLIDEVVKQRGVEFTAKALVYARSKMGQRSVTHFGGVALARHLSGSLIGKYIYSKYNRKDEIGGLVYRLDDMLEMIAAYMALNPGKRLPNSMSRGFRTALENADTYELAKYQASSKNVSLVDAFNLLHPRPSNEKMAEVFKQLMNGELKQFNTVEDKNTKVGQEVAKKVKSGELSKEEADEVLSDAKNDNFNELLKSGKIGYKALVMNLRNILKVGDDSTISLAVKHLTNSEAIRKSLIQPMELDVAAEVLVAEGVGSTQSRTKILKALETAFELSIPNMSEVFHGETAVVFDTSGSMQGGWGSGVSIPMGKDRVKINSTPAQKSALIASMFVKGVGADVYHFASTCERISYNPMDTFNTIKKTFMAQNGKVGHGTSFDSIVDTLRKSKKRYNRVIVISDMQGHDSFKHSTLDGNPYIYSIDMCGYGTTMANPKNPKVFALYGYSAEMVRVATQMEIDPKTLIKEIEAVRLY